MNSPSDDLVTKALKLLAVGQPADSVGGTIQLDKTLTRLRADGSHASGIVDLLHTDETGTLWAFVTFTDGRWTGVNTKGHNQFDCPSGLRTVPAEGKKRARNLPRRPRAYPSAKGARDDPST